MRPLKTVGFCSQTTVPESNLTNLSTRSIRAGLQTEKPAKIAGLSSRSLSLEIPPPDLLSNDPVDFCPRLEDNTIMKGEHR
jgi:hypothetical protein